MLHKSSNYTHLEPMGLWFLKLVYCENESSRAREGDEEEECWEEVVYSHLVANQEYSLMVVFHYGDILWTVSQMY